MLIKEIKKFVISQMSSADWVSDDSRDLIKRTSKYLIIRVPTTGPITFIIKSEYGHSDFELTRKELNINIIHFWILFRRVKKSCNRLEIRKREKDISNQWNRFLEKNKDLKRDSKINQVLK